ncbi:MAG: nucleotidyl transferase AbiEii/AbiGii toxin family protein [Trueperaceae bacterium]|nr:MAG: nucleotidyl transferase AbiEii/AbiGii toxin family protein [Trueperaceae bacterium]
MAEALLELEASELRDILDAGASNGPWVRDVLEKDLWVVWCLDTLFRQPNAPHYAFKGGTSLSKVYRVIDRFSEDVDVTVSTQDPRILGDDDPLADSISNNRRKALNEQAEENLNRFLTATVAPYVIDHASATLPSWHRPEVIAEGATIRIMYPSALPHGSEPPYIERHVLLEFGTRGGTEPRAPHSVTSYLEQAVEPTGDLTFPRANGVMTLSVERTFWEKATLIHAELARPHRALKERYVRHWYDLHRLSTHLTIGPHVLAAASALAQVIDMKTKQFRSGGVHYEDCGRGALRLAPDGAQRTRLRDDYRRMQASGMFLAESPAFDAIIDQLHDLEATINATYAETPVV